MLEKFNTSSIYSLYTDVTRFGMVPRFLHPLFYKYYEIDVWTFLVHLFLNDCEWGKISQHLFSVTRRTECCRIWKFIILEQPYMLLNVWDECDWLPIRRLLRAREKLFLVPFVYFLKFQLFSTMYQALHTFYLWFIFQFSSIFRKWWFIGNILMDYTWNINWLLEIYWFKNCVSFDEVGYSTWNLKFCYI